MQTGEAGRSAPSPPVAASRYPACAVGMMWALLGYMCAVRFVCWVMGCLCSFPRKVWATQAAAPSREGSRPCVEYLQVVSFEERL